MSRNPLLSPLRNSRRVIAAVRLIGIGDNQKVQLFSPFSSLSVALKSPYTETNRDPGDKAEMRYAEFQPQHCKAEFEAEKQMLHPQHISSFQLLDSLSGPSTHM